MAGQTDYQARHLRDHAGIDDVAFLLDPTHSLRGTIGAGRLRLTGLLSPRGAWNYVGAMGRARAGRIVDGWNLTPAVVIVDPGLRVQMRWVGRTYGDYPPATEVVATLEGLAR